MCLKHYANQWLVLLEGSRHCHWGVNVTSQKGKQFVGIILETADSLELPRQGTEIHYTK